MKLGLELVLVLIQCFKVEGKLLEAGLTPVPQYKASRVFGSSGARRYGGRNSTSNTSGGLSFVQDQLGFSPGEYIIKNDYTSESNGVRHVYLRQMVAGLEVFNADINLNLDPAGNVLSYGDTFLRLPKRRMPFGFPSEVRPAEEGLGALLAYLAPASARSSSSGFSSDFSRAANREPKAAQGWIQLSTGELEAVWAMDVELEEDWVHGHVSATSLEVLGAHSWISEASYSVFPFGVNDPSQGSRVLMQDPHDTLASPLGWHDQEGTQFTSTAGNNVYAVGVSPRDPAELDESARVQNPNLNFVYDLDLQKQPEEYKNASITNLFFWSNLIHDLYYRYGFDERAGNFQENNFGKGGEGNDAILAHGQDHSNLNNAYFATPPDGRRPRMAMFLWSRVAPRRDGDLDSGIIIHEYTHGLSNRLTGGPANVDCLRTPESGGLGEGWGDFMAIILQTTPNATRSLEFGMGQYVATRPTIRPFLYSTNLQTNPATFKILTTPPYKEVHAKGSVWAVMLYEVYWNLLENLPFSPDWFLKSHPPETSGNTLMLQLTIDAMKLQPCNPTFIQARDAIVQAESLLTKGQYGCAIWSAFAKRGLGVDAKVIHGINVDGNQIPPNCA